MLHSLDSIPIVYLSIRCLFTSRSAEFSESERTIVVERIANSIPALHYIELQWPEPHTVDIRRDSPPSYRLWWHIKRECEWKIEELSKEAGMSVRKEWTVYPIRGIVDQALFTAI